ncbi:Transmembrane protein 216 [Myotis brandtii]|uniref:Transmembrane protein 216 n=1 Tax=Myotis brandtii TaxID=109478 RepID=S7PSH8_MYOBR|nr:Transmembrane protein 216 [Myotis brandtii]
MGTDPLGGRAKVDELREGAGHCCGYRAHARRALGKRSRASVNKAEGQVHRGRELRCPRARPGPGSILDRRTLPASAGWENLLQVQLEQSATWWPRAPAPARLVDLGARARSNQGSRRGRQALPSPSPASALWDRGAVPSRTGERRLLGTSRHSREPSVLSETATPPRELPMGHVLITCSDLCSLKGASGSVPGERLSSTPLEILFFLNGWYYATYFLLELFIFLYKGLLLPYPTANLVLDVAMLLLSLGIEVIRLFFGSKGNLCQRKMPLAISVALTFPSALMASYYLLLQTYVLRLEAIMNGILLLFCGSELLLEVLTLAAFSSTGRGTLSPSRPSSAPAPDGRKSSSLTIVARASRVDHVGSLASAGPEPLRPVCCARLSRTSTELQGTQPPSCGA